MPRRLEGRAEGRPSHLLRTSDPGLWKDKKTHELLTPLSVIQASVEELNLQYPRMKSQLRGISDNSMRLIRLIQQILEFRKVENAKQQLRVSEGNITLFIKRSVIAFTPLVRKKKLYIALENFDTPCTGYFDSDKLERFSITCCQMRLNTLSKEGQSL